MYNTAVRGKLIDGDKSLNQISEEILAPIHDNTPLWWYAAFTVSMLLFTWGAISIYITVTQGIGTWGVNNTVG